MQIIIIALWCLCHVQFYVSIIIIYAGERRRRRMSGSSISKHQQQLLHQLLSIPILFAPSLHLQLIHRVSCLFTQRLSLEYYCYLGGYYYSRQPEDIRTLSMLLSSYLWHLQELTLSFPEAGRSWSEWVTESALAVIFCPELESPPLVAWNNCFVIIVINWLLLIIAISYQQCSETKNLSKK